MNELLAYTPSTRETRLQLSCSAVRLRRGLLGLTIGLAGLVTGACGGDDSSGPTATAYTITANEDDAEPQQDGSVQLTYTVTVKDSAGAIVPGAGLKFEVSKGTITASNSISDADGTGKVRWTLNAGEVAAGGNVTLKACADSRTQADCTPTSVATRSLG